MWIEALKESSISIACALDEVGEVTKEDLEHIQKQITRDGSNRSSSR